MLKNLINESVFIIRETIAQFKRPAVMWSTGKDSTVVLDLISMALNGIDMPVIHIDTGRKFPEIFVLIFQLLSFQNTVGFFGTIYLQSYVVIHNENLLHVV